MKVNKIPHIYCKRCRQAGKEGGVENIIVEGIMKIRCKSCGSCSEYYHAGVWGIDKIKEKLIKEETVMQEEKKEIKGKHKSCKNHPDKYAWKDGLCYRCYTVKNGHTKKLVKKPVDKAIDRVVDIMVDKIQPEVRQAESMVIHIDFNNYPELLEKLRNIAKLEIRALQDEILYMIGTYESKVNSMTYPGIKR